MGISDAPKAFLDVMGRLELRLGELGDQLKKDRELAIARIPLDATIAAGGVYPASGSLVLRLSTPSAGRVQQLRRLTVTGGDTTTSVAGSCILFELGTPPVDGKPTGMIDNSITPLPCPAFYSTHQVVIRYPDSLWAVIVNGSAGQAYNVTGEVEDFDARVFAGYIE